MLRADLLVGLGRLDEAFRSARRTADLCRRYGWDVFLGATLRSAASAAAKQGRLEEAEGLLRDAEEASRACGEDLEIAHAILYLSDIVRMQGRHREALRCGKRAYARYAVVEDRRGQADALAGLAAACLGVGDLVRAERYSRQAIPHYQSIGVRFGEASVQNTLGDVLRKRGALADATASYLVSQQVLKQLGSPERYIPMFNLGLVLITRSRASEARAYLEPCRAAMARAGRRGLEGALNAALMCCDADVRDWVSWDRHAGRALILLDASGLVDVDIAQVAERAADLAVTAGHGRRALGAWHLATNQWRSLGQVERVEALESSSRSMRKALSGAAAGR